MWVTTEKFLEHFSIEHIDNLPGLEELKASGFLDKRAAISTISDLSKIENENIEIDNDEEESLEDFITPESS